MHAIRHSAFLHHSFELPVADEQPVRMARQCDEVPLLIKARGSVGETIEHDGDEGEGCVPAIVIDSQPRALRWY